MGEDVDEILVVCCCTCDPERNGVAGSHVE